MAWLRNKTAVVQLSTYSTLCFGKIWVSNKLAICFNIKLVVIVASTLVEHNLVWPPGTPRSLMDTLFDADHHGENRFSIGGLGEVG